MGNCSLKGVDCECPYNNNNNSIRLFTGSGEVVEMKGPKLAKNVLSEYSGYGIFRQGNASSPLSSYEYLIGGQFYYLEKMPITLCDNRVTNDRIRNLSFEKKNMGLIESPKVSSGIALDFGEGPALGPAPAPAVEVLPSQGNGVWKVKLVINPKQLEEILSEQGYTEALIEKMRMAASLAPSRRNNSYWKPCLSNVFNVFPSVGPNKS